MALTIQPQIPILQMAEIQACLKRRESTKALKLFLELEKNPLVCLQERDYSLVIGYSPCDKAHALFQSMLERGIPSTNWSRTALVQAHCAERDYEGAYLEFRQMEKPDDYAYSVIIKQALRANRAHDAFELAKEWETVPEKTKIQLLNAGHKVLVRQRETIFKYLRENPQAPIDSRNRETYIGACMNEDRSLALELLGPLFTPPRTHLFAKISLAIDVVNRFRGVDLLEPEDIQRLEQFYHQISQDIYEPSLLISLFDILTFNFRAPIPEKIFQRVFTDPEFRRKIEPAKLDRMINSLMHAYNKSEEPQKALDTYEKCHQAHIPLTNLLIQDQRICAHVLLDQIGEAKRVFHLHIESYNIKWDIRDYTWELDCHDVTAGTAYIQLLLYVESKLNRRGFDSFHLIVGRGSTNTERNPSIMKEFLKEKIDKDPRMNWIQHLHNSGVLVITAPKNLCKSTYYVEKTER